jgi:tetratricopeptide (TPR) repeat protein
VLRAQGQLEEALAAHEAALRLTLDRAEIHYNLGAVWRELGELAAAAAAYDTALSLQPDYAEAQWNRSLVWLSRGDLASGWPAYEWRWQTVQTPRAVSLPQWDGGSLAQRTILVTAEQGLGDEMLFASCVPDLLRPPQPGRPRGAGV